MILKQMKKLVNSKNSLHWYTVPSVLKTLYIVKNVSIIPPLLINDKLI